ncbi:MAG TPA: substrate-binding domain-containing protein [Steroidobacteraceae bacterium]|jgi:molybdate transport system substrate-binding protein|nr:substrate-binding domain-containing protein [Steroidobacteraceae bacterium]
MTTRALKVLSSMAAREVLAELIRGFITQSGQPVIAEAAGGVEVARRVQAGDEADVVVLADSAIDKLIAASALRAGRVDLVKSGVAIAVRSGRPRPDVSTEDAVKAAVEAASSLSYSTGPSGVYLEKLFARWGILEAVRPRIVVPPPGVPVGSLVASGHAALGFQQLSELLNVAGIEVLGPLPAAIQTITTFSAGISVRCEQPQLAARLLDYMCQPAANAVKQSYGMEPA